MNSPCLLNVAKHPLIPPIGEKIDKFNIPLKGYVGSIFLKGESEPETAQDSSSSFLSSDYPAGEKTAYVNDLVGQSHWFGDSTDALSDATPASQASDTASLSESDDTDEANTAEYALAFFEESLLFLNKSARGDLPDFEKFCVAVPSLRQNVANAIKALDSIKDIFKEVLLFQPKSDVLDEHAFQVRVDKLKKIATAFTTLQPIQNDIETIERSFKRSLPSEKQSYFIRTFNAVVSVFCTILSCFAIPTTPISLFFSAGNFAFESRNYVIKQNLAEWKAFRKTLQKLNQYNPIKEEDVLPILNTLRNTQTQQAAENRANAQELESTKAELLRTQDVLAQVLTRLQALEAKDSSEQSQAESTAITPDSSAHESNITNLRQVA